MLANTFGKVIVSIAVMFTAYTSSAQQILSLQQALKLAKNNDPWLHSNSLKQSAIEYKGIAANTLADPKVSLSFNNIPTDSWDLNQENMTQTKVAISQVLPRGESTKIAQQQLAIQASAYPYLRADRQAKVAVIVANLWLDAYLAQSSIKQLQTDKTLFEQMIDIANASYASAVGKTRQQDVIRAQLELVQLEDRITVEQQAFESAIAQLAQWLYLYQPATDTEFYGLNKTSSALGASQGFTNSKNVMVSDKLPDIALANTTVFSATELSPYALAEVINQHPILLSMETNYQASTKGITLAQQKYQPQWEVNASYGYRDDSPAGIERSDFFSVGVSFDLPIFTENKQDKEVAASVAESQAIKTDKLLQLRAMVSQVTNYYQKLKRLDQRQALYQQQLMIQSHQQSEAALTAYTNDDGSFSDVIQARIMALNTQIAATKINVERLKTIVSINYYFLTGLSAKEYAHGY